MQRLNRSGLSARRDGGGASARAAERQPGRRPHSQPERAECERPGRRRRRRRGRAHHSSGGFAGDHGTLTLLPLFFFPLFPPPFSNFSSSIFTCETLQAVIGKLLTYWTAFQSNSIKSDLYRASHPLPRRPAMASPGPPSRCLQRGSSKGAGEGSERWLRYRLLSPSAPAGLRPAPGSGGDISLPSPRARLQRGQRSAKRRSEAGPQPRTRGRWPRGVPRAGPGLGERLRSHLSRLRAAAGRLSGHFFRDVNRALTYYIDPLIAKDAFRVGGQRAVTPPPRGAPAPLLCRRMR